MTSQVAVLNLECAAVASDSLRTLTFRDGRRTFESAEKVFELGPGHQVVALISGDARFMAVPWSLLIGEWAATQFEPLSSVPDYADALVRWLSERSDLFSGDVQAKFFGWQLRELYLTIRRRIVESLDSADLSHEDWTDLDVLASVNSSVSDVIDELSSRDNLEGIDQACDAKYLRRVESLIRNEFDYVFDDVPRTVLSDVRLLQEVPVLLVAKNAMSRSDSTIAFVGYGVDDMFPIAHALTLHGLVNDAVRGSSWLIQGVDREGTARIVPFAQADAIHAFMNGNDVGFLKSVHDAIDSVFKEKESSIDEEQILDSGGSSMSGLADELHRQVDAACIERSREVFLAPLLATIAAMPRVEMAGIAASLVELQTLRIGTSAGTPTVGGAIEVVVISRAHGVQWVRPKDDRLATWSKA